MDGLNGAKFSPTRVAISELADAVLFEMEASRAAMVNCLLGFWMQLLCVARRKARLSFRAKMKYCPSIYFDTFPLVILRELASSKRFNEGH